MNKPRITRDYKMPASMRELPFGPSAPAGVLIEPNASWRIRRPVVDAEKCIRCLICWTLCPEGVIDKNIEIDMNFCKGCGICANECPKGAVTMISAVSVHGE